MSAPLPRSLTLGELERRGLGRVVAGDPDTVVTGVRHDSREVRPGDLFVAIAGRASDGAKFAGDALSLGAAGLAVEARVSLDAPLLLVDDARRALGSLAAAVYGDPTRELRVIGLTGTNGKTTTTWLIDEALRALSQRPALLGTIESRGPGVRASLLASAFTTPEGDAIARFARQVVDAGATHLVMEVSSHALALHRADAVCFEVAAFTNLTQDHLDFHGTMEAYLEAKARLFTELSPRHAVINVDDPAGEALARRIPHGTARIGVSRRADADAEVRVLEHSTGRTGFDAVLSFRGKRAALSSPMLGEHNVDNCLLAAGCLFALGHEPDAVVRALSQAVGAPGRLERVEGLTDIGVLVDYAHTPDALGRALDALRPITPGRLIVVFGCGGDRDQGKRPLMGEAAGRGADVAIVTSDNPRTEDPHAILQQIAPGLLAAGCVPLEDAGDLGVADRGFVVLEDRRTAIRCAVTAARPGDTVLIAGKGHEDYQLRGDARLHFDDREEARLAISARQAGEG